MVTLPTPALPSCLVVCHSLGKLKIGLSGSFLLFFTLKACEVSDCISLISGYWAICLWRSTERVRNVSPSRLTSVLATVLCLVLGVGFCCWLVFSCFGASCLVVFLSSLVHHTLRHT